MTTPKQRTTAISLHRVLIMIFALIGIWWEMNLPEDIFFTLGTAVWVWAPKLVQLELKIFDRYHK